MWWEKSIATWHGAIIAEGGTILGGSASQTLRLVPMGWIQLLQTWSHERLALMLGFGHSEKFGNWNWLRRCADFPVGNILPAANLPSVNCGLFRARNNHSSALSFSTVNFLIFPPLDFRLRPLDLGTRVYGPEHWGPVLNHAALMH